MGLPWWKMRALNPGRTLARSTAITPYKAVAKQGKMGLEVLPKYGEAPSTTFTGQLLGSGQRAIQAAPGAISAGAAQAGTQSSRNMLPWLIAGGGALAAGGIGAYLANQQRDMSPYPIPFERPPLGTASQAQPAIAASTVAASAQPSSEYQLQTTSPVADYSSTPVQVPPIPQMIAQGALPQQDVPPTQDVYGDPNAGRYAAIAGLLGQLGQAVTARDPNSLGYQLGGIATRAAQAQLYNRYLSQLVGQGGDVEAQGSNFPSISPLESFSLGPEAQGAAQGRLEESRSADVDRLYKLALMTGVETPQQLLQRQILTGMISGKGQQDLQLVEDLKIGPDGKPTKTPQKWYANPATGELVKHIGEQFESERTAGVQSPAQTQSSYRAADKGARQLALVRLKVKYPESIVKNPVTGEFDIGFVPPGSNLLQDFNNEYLTAVKFYQQQGQLPAGWEQIAGGTVETQQPQPLKYGREEEKK